MRLKELFKKENMEIFISFTIVFGMLILLFFLPYGIGIFMSILLSFYLSVTFKDEFVVDLTMLIITIFFVVIGFIVKFKIDQQGAFMIFSLLSGYILFKVSKSYFMSKDGHTKKERISNKGQK